MVTEVCYGGFFFSKLCDGYCWRCLYVIKWEQKEKLDFAAKMGSKRRSLILLWMCFMLCERWQSWTRDWFVVLGVDVFMCVKRSRVSVSMRSCKRGSLITRMRFIMCERWKRRTKGWFVHWVLIGFFWPVKRLQVSFLIKRSKRRCLIF